MERTQSKGVNIRIIVILVIMYVIVAMSDNFKGVFVPVFKENFSVSNTQIGYMMTVSLLAYAVFQYFGGVLIEKLGFKRVMILGSVLAALALVSIVFCSGYGMLLAGMFVLNAGMALFNVTINTLGPMLTVASTAVLMNMLVAGYSASNTVLQRVSGILLGKGVSWTMFYGFMLICLVILVFCIATLKIPYQPQTNTVDKKQNRSAIFKNPMLYLYVLVAAAYLGAEYGMGNWFVNYMSDSFGLGADQRGVYMTAYVGIRTVSLLLGGFVADKLGQYRSIMLYAGAGAVLMGLGVFAGRGGLWIICAAGFTFAVIFPGIITTIKSVFHESTSYATGFILMGGTLGAMCISTLMGILNDVIGTRITFYIMPLCMLLTLVLTGIIKGRIKQKSDTLNDLENVLT